MFICVRELPIHIDMSCSKCKLVLPCDGLFVECKACEGSYHFDCSSLSEKSYKSMSEVKKAAWKCATCKGRKLSASSENLSSETLEKLFAELKRDLEKSQQFLAEKYEELLNKMNVSNETISNLNKTIESLVGKVQERDEVISDLTSRVNHLEQYGRNCNLELSEVRERRNENLLEVVSAVAKKMNIDLSPGDIDVVHRLPGKPEKTRGIIVQFLSRKKRDEFVLKKNKFSITNDDIYSDGNATKVYVNENLTPFFKQLLWQAKSVASGKGYKFTWFRFGKLFVKQDESSPVIKISKVGDLDKLVDLRAAS